jgi:hypothetical protein
VRSLSIFNQVRFLMTLLMTALYFLIHLKMAQCGRVGEYVVLQHICPITASIKISWGECHRCLFTQNHMFLFVLLYRSPLGAPKFVK